MDAKQEEQGVSYNALLSAFCWCAWFDHRWSEKRLFAGISVSNVGAWWCVGKLRARWGLEKSWWGQVGMKLRELREVKKRNRKVSCFEGPIWPAVHLCPLQREVTRAQDIDFRSYLNRLVGCRMSRWNWYSTKKIDIRWKMITVRAIIRWKQ